MNLDKLLFGQLRVEAGGADGGGAGAGGAGAQSGAGADAGGSAAGGAGGDDWRATLPDDIRADKSLADIKDVGALAKTYIESQKLIGRSIRIPGKDAGKADIDAFQGKLKEIPGVLFMPDGADEAALGDLYAKLGRPDSPDKYQIARPKSLPEGMVYNEVREKSMRAVAHKLGLTQQQLDGLFQAYNAEEIQAGEARAQENKKSKAELRAEWGAGYDQRLAAAQVFLKQFADADTASALSGALPTYPGLAKALSAAGLHFIEDGVIKGDGGTLAPSVSELREKIAEIKNNKDHPYHDRKKPGHAEAVARVDAYHAQIAEIEKAAKG